VLLGLVLGQIFQQGQDALGTTFADSANITAFLQDFTRNVQRQVGRIDHTAHKAQVSRQQLLGVVHDEYAFHVQLHATASIAVPQVKRGLLGDEQELGVFATTFDPVVCPGQRVLVIVSDVLVELLVLLVGDFRLGACPQGAGLVHAFPLVLLYLLLLFFV